MLVSTTALMICINAILLVECMTSLTTSHTSREVVWNLFGISFSSIAVGVGLYSWLTQT